MHMHGIHEEKNVNGYGYVDRNRNQSVGVTVRIQRHTHSHQESFGASTAGWSGRPTSCNTFLPAIIQFNRLSVYDVCEVV
jgi:hypothetical protein